MSAYPTGRVDRAFGRFFVYFGPVAAVAFAICLYIKALNQGHWVLWLGIVFSAIATLSGALAARPRSGVIWFMLAYVCAAGIAISVAGTVVMNL